MLVKKVDQVERRMQLRVWPVSIDDTLSVWEEPYFFFCIQEFSAACVTLACDRLGRLLFLCGFLVRCPGEGYIVFTEYFDSQKWWGGRGRGVSSGVMCFSCSNTYTKKCNPSPR